MERKDAGLPRMFKPQAQNQTSTSFKVRPNLMSKDKQNKIQKTVQQAKANNFLTKARSFNSPQLIFALNQTIREECSTMPSQFMPNQSMMMPSRYTVCGNKTFHSSTDSKSLSKFYAFDKSRDRTIELSRWVTDKLDQLKQKSTISLDDVLDYNQTVVNFGLGELIQSVRSKCKQQGQLLKFVWDNTFVMFEWVVNVLTKEVDKKDKQITENEKQLEILYRTSMSSIINEKKQLQTHIDLLYDKMNKVVLWNRRLRKDRFKQQIQIRMRDYRLQTYTSALEEATSMLLTQSREPNCLKLARKIISKLYRQKGIRSHKKYRRNRIKLEAQQHVHETSKQFVINWLKKYSFAQNQKIENAVFLSEDQKMQIMKLSDQNQVDNVDIYDFFQTANQAVQTERNQVDQEVQYEKYAQNQMKNVAVETKRVYKMTVGIQNVMIDTQLEKKKNENKLGNIASRNGNRKLTKNDGDVKIRKNERNLTKIVSPQLKKKGSNTTNISQGGKRKNTLNNKGKQGRQDLQQIQIENFVTKNQNENDGIFCDDIHDTQSVDFWKQQNRHQSLSASAKQITDENKLDSASRIYHKQKMAKFMLIDEDKNQGIDQDAKSQFSLFKSTAAKDTKDSLHMFNHKNLRKLSSQRYITQSSQQNQIGYKSKTLQFRRFDDAYQNQMKAEVQNNKQQIIKTVVRRRSFYKSNKYRQQDTEKALMYLWYKPTKVMDWKPKRQLNKLDEQIYNYFSNLNKQLSLPVSFPKSKAFQQTCSLFTSVSTSLSMNQSRAPLPRNKQFINLSVANITKFISRLLFDYLRKIRSEREGISLISQPQRVYYPLSIVVVDHMMHQYGLREIAEKKLKDFMDKIGNFVTVSQRLAFFYKLIGFGEESAMAADELLIYMKCLVLLDTSRTIPIMSSITKDFTVDRMTTDKETVLQNVGEIIRQFFRENLRAQVKWKIERYFHLYQLNGSFDIERIAVMLIDEFAAVKKAEYDHYLPIYKNCGGNFFPNLRKTLEVYCQSDILPVKYQQTLQEMFRNADILDENYGKSISQLRFIGLCIRLSIPKYEQIQTKMRQLQSKFIKSVNMKQIGEESTQQGQEAINKIKKKYNIKIGVEKETPDYWTWTCAQISYDASLINTYNLLGHLGNLKNCYQSLRP